MFHKSEISFDLSQYYNSLKFGSIWKPPTANPEAPTSRSEARNGQPDTEKAKGASVCP